MIGLASLRWALTVAFAGAALFHLLRCLRPTGSAPAGSLERRTTEMLHLSMSLSMIAMVWPWGRFVPQPVWPVLFLAAAGWFVARAVWSPGSRLGPAFFATAMLAMAWMGVSMPARPPGGGHHPGMIMAAPGGYPAWISAVLGGYLVLAAGWWIIRGMRIGGLSTAVAAFRAPHWPAVCHGVMSAGMGLALLAMA